MSGYPILAAIDLDGTLLDANGELPPQNRDAIRHWVKSGRFLAILTSRSPQGMRSILSELNVPCFAGAFNGGLAWTGSAPDWTEGPSLIDVPLPSEVALNVWDACRELSLPVILYTRLGAIGNIQSEAIQHEVSTTGELIAYSKVIDPTNVAYKLNIMISGSGDKEVLERLPMVQHTYINVTRGGNIELTSPIATKGRALSVARASMGIDNENVIAFGDGDNDVSMFKSAGVSIAVPGATRMAQESADILLSGNDPTVVGATLLRVLSWRSPGPKEYGTLGSYRHRQH